MTDPTPLSTDPYHIAYALRASDPNRTDPQLLRDAAAVIRDLANDKDEWSARFAQLVNDKYDAMKSRDIAQSECEHWRSNHDTASRKVEKMRDEITALRLFVDGQKFNGNYHPPTQEAIAALREAVRLMGINLRDLARNLDLYAPSSNRDNPWRGWIARDVLANEIAAAAVTEASQPTPPPKAVYPILKKELSD